MSNREKREHQDSNSSSTMDWPKKESRGRHRAPNDFSRSFSDLFDRDFMGFLAGSFVLHAALVVYFLFNPVSSETMSKQIADMQRRIAQTIKEREKAREEQFVQFKFEEKVPEVEEVAEVPEIKPADATKKVAKAEAVPEKKPRARRPRKKISQDQIAKNVSNKGVLALLASNSSTASGREVSMILSNASSSMGDLDATLSKISGLKSSGKSDMAKGAGDIKGSRDGGGAGIDALVGDLGSANEQSFERSGDLVIASGSPEVEEGGVGVAGRQPEDLQEVVVTHNKSIQYCYERQLKRNPNLKGKISVRFTIAPDGTVSNVELISSTLNNQAVERCVVSRIRRWNDFGVIDTSHGNTTIRQTYAFGY